MLTRQCLGKTQPNRPEDGRVNRITEKGQERRPQSPPALLIFRVSSTPCPQFSNTIGTGSLFVTCFVC
ncbi:hypothetical protein GN956_G25959 [Arapaima gigas]